ncbi:hypothetical protein OJF2_23660 [Aquisphaera giovannonii]|uniref:Nickel uptake substrate-specific transmembrane region n=1 Tax=Aquisphaera giovannonii TaxID=406548 RepID=A0A5B9VZJ1_9BACT|nr:hypothetical protein [Aquisphaera giovannonii]QEH33836.1 hypothetical protein OJF2_23660 [Aquisphaera giovannonii]
MGLVGAFLASCLAAAQATQIRGAVLSQDGRLAAVALLRSWVWAVDNREIDAEGTADEGGQFRMPVPPARFGTNDDAGPMH